MKKKKEALDMTKNGTSGAHVFAFNPEQNHVDFFKGGTLTHKEYPEIRGSTNYGYTLSGSVLII